MSAVIDWLFSGPPWVQYQARRDLLGESAGAPALVAARQEVLRHPLLTPLLAELAGWPGPALKRHNDAGQILHKLTVAADLGLCATDPPLAPVVERILQNPSPQGPFPVLANIAPAFGGSGQDQMVWMLCDAPLTLYALVKLGCGEDRRVWTAVDYLASLARDNGWPCAACPEVGRFRGPGRRSDPCPYATLIMLRLLAQRPEWRASPAAHSGAQALLDLWQQRHERRPYLFAMGSDFCKLKAPLIWYDIVHVLDVLTQFEWLRGEPRLGEMAALVAAKADAAGRFTPESVWKAWAGWDVGQKREPSPWLSLIVLRLLYRLERPAFSSEACTAGRGE